MLQTRPYRLTFALELDDAPASSARALFVINQLLQCLFAIDIAYLKGHPQAPSLADSGVQFMAEPPGQEDWQDIPTTREMGYGDAEDLAAWYAAEQWVRGGRRLYPEFQPVAGPQGVATYRVGIRDAQTDLWTPYPQDAQAAPQPASAFRRVTFGLDLFRGDYERELSREALSIMLHCLYAIDVRYLQDHPDLVPVYRSKVRYMEEPPGQEDWQDAATCVRMGVADCEDLASWRAAERTVREGRPSKPIYVEQARPDGGMLYHIVVADAQGQVVEDPSHITGMR